MNPFQFGDLESKSPKDLSSPQLIDICAFAYLVSIPSPILPEKQILPLSNVVWVQPTPVLILKVGMLTIPPKHDIILFTLLRSATELNQTLSGPMRVRTVEKGQLFLSLAGRV